MNNNIIKFVSLMLVFFSVGTLVHATGEGFYIGGQAGVSNTNNEDQTVQTGGPPPTGNSTLDASNQGVGERIYLGYNINSYFGVEGGFTHYAPSTYTVPSNPQLTAGNPTGTPSIAENGFDLVGKLMYPIPFANLGLGVFGKAGAAFIGQTKSGTLTSTYNSTTHSTDTTSGATTYVRPTASVGVSYDLTQSWVLDFTVSRVFSHGDFQNADLMSFGISYHFVTKYCGQFVC